MMNDIDDRVEHLIYQVLLRAGVLPTDRDARVLRRYVIQVYFRQLIDEPASSRRELLIALTESVMTAHLRVGQTNARPEGVEARSDFANWTQLTQNERDVLYLLATVGLSETQIVEKLGASSDWVDVAIAKLESMYERPLVNESDWRKDL